VSISKKFAERVLDKQAVPEELCCVVVVWPVDRAPGLLEFDGYDTVGAGNQVIGPAA